MELMVVQNDDNSLRLRRTDIRPPNFVCTAPEETILIDHLIIEDDVDEETGEVIGKKSRIDNALVAAYNADMLARKQARDAKEQTKEQRKTALLNVFNNFDSLPQDQKMNAVKQIIELLLEL